jgi:hypothetical protein
VFGTILPNFLGLLPLWVVNKKGRLLITKVAPITLTYDEMARASGEQGSGVNHDSSKQKHYTLAVTLNVKF